MFAQLFALAIAVTASVAAITVLLARQEVRRRATQRRQPFIVNSARGLGYDDDVRGAGQNAELLYSISRLG